jgi:hypothetical protein
MGRFWQVEANLGAIDRWSYLGAPTEFIESAFVEGATPSLTSDPLGAYLSLSGYGPPPTLGREELWAPPRGIRDLIVRHSLPSQSLLPPSEVLFQDTMTDGRWDLEEEFPLSGYRIPVGEAPARWYAPLAHQMAVFPRGDSVVVVAAYDLPAHGVDASTRVDAGLAILPAADGLGDLRVMRSDGTIGTGVFAMTAAAVPSFLSLELIIPEEGALARARHGVDLAPRPMGIPILSDLLLISEGALPESLTEAVAEARPSSRALPGEELGIYWELHGLDLLDLAEVPVSLALHPPPSGGLVGALRWLGERIGVLGEVQPVRTSWMEEVGEGSFMGRSIGFHLPEEGEGRYLIELRVELPGREPLVTLQEVEVTRSTLRSLRNAIVVRRPLLTRLASVCATGETGRRCWATSGNPSIFGHYGGSLHLSDYGYDGW